MTCLRYADALWDDRQLYMIAMPTTELFNPTCIYFDDPIFFCIFLYESEVYRCDKSIRFHFSFSFPFFSTMLLNEKHTHIKYLSLLLRTLYCYTIIVTVIIAVITTVITTDITMTYTAEV